MDVSTLDTYGLCVQLEEHLPPDEPARSLVLELQKRHLRLVGAMMESSIGLQTTLLELDAAIAFGDAEVWPGQTLVEPPAAI